MGACHAGVNADFGVSYSKMNVEVLETACADKNGELR
jgi:hypothetical protein